MVAMRDVIDDVIMIVVPACYTYSRTVVAMYCIIKPLLNTYLFSSYVTHCEKDCIDVREG